MKSTSTRSALRAALMLVALAAASACGPDTEPPKPAPETLPDLGAERIRETLYDEGRVDAVPPESGSGETITWRFVRREPTDVTIVEKQMDGERATVVIDVAAHSAPGARSPKALSGSLRVNYRLETEVFLRVWRIYDIENISFKYRDEPKPAGNANSNSEPDDEDGPPEPPPPPPQPPG